MSADFEAWLYRGVIAALSSIAAWFVVREIKAKDGLRVEIAKNRETASADLAAMRSEFTNSLDRVVGQFRMSIEALNTTTAHLAQTIGSLEATIAKEYATRDDLRQLKEDLHREMDSCADRCAMIARREGVL